MSGAQASQRVKGLAVLLYLLGLSYGATSLALEVVLSKTRVYDVVQAAAERVPGMTRTAVFSDIPTRLGRRRDDGALCGRLAAPGLERR